jgi:archaellum component FlaC
MFNGPQVAELVFGITTILLAMWGIASKMSSSLRGDVAELKHELTATIAKMQDAHDERVKEANTQYNSTTASFATLHGQINTILQGDVRRLDERVKRLESGQDEWTKTLRDRTHDLANELNAQRLQIELLKAAKVAS